jgi:hypothetical protein
VPPAAANDEAAGAALTAHLAGDGPVTVLLDVDPHAAVQPTTIQMRNHFSHEWGKHLSLTGRRAMMQNARQDRRRALAAGGQ